MNEKLQYAEMLDLPDTTCTVTVKPPKRSLFPKRKRQPKEVKEELLKMVNEKASEEEKQEVIAEEVVTENAETPEKAKRESLFNIFKKKEKVKECGESEDCENATSVVREKRKERKPFKVSIIGVELAVIALLIGTITVTGALIPNSGVKVFLESVFGGKEQASAIDDRGYADFKASLPVSGSDIVLKDGVMTLKGTESVYTPCDGKITALNKTEDGKYDMEITHGENFITVFTGMDYAYFALGDKVCATIPVGRVSGGTATVCFKGGDGAIITDYTLSDSAVIWAV